MSTRRRRRSIFEIMKEYMEEFERAAEEMISSAFERPSWDVESSSLEPLCSIFVTPKEVVVTADLPYTKPETIKVEAVSEDLIEIAADMRRRFRFQDFGVMHRSGDFTTLRCQARIPVPVNTKRMKIRFRRGILEIHLPRKRGYRIKVA